MRILYKMKCGHVSNSTCNDKPYCVICSCGLVEKEVKSNEGLENRLASCIYCRREKPSDWELPFFSYNEDKDTDSYYCGCRGWD